MQKKLIERYLLKFDELNRISPTILEAETETEAVNRFNDILVDAYYEGFTSALFVLYDIELDGEQLTKALDRFYDGESIQDKVKGYYRDKDKEGTKRLVESEYHRVYNTARDDAFGGKSKTDSKGKTVKSKGYPKRWLTVSDDRVRETHVFLDGVTVEAGERFYTIDGDSALFPGGFEKSENNANCRCIIDYLI